MKILVYGEKYFQIKKTEIRCAGLKAVTKNSGEIFDQILTFILLSPE